MPERSKLESPWKFCRTRGKKWLSLRRPSTRWLVSPTRSCVRLGAGRGFHSLGSRSGASGLTVNRACRSSTPAMPSTMQWCTLMMRAKRSFSTPSTTQNSQSGRLRSRCCENSRPTRRLSERSSPGSGKRVWRRWKFMLKRSSSTQTGCPYPGIHSTRCR